MSAQPPPPPLYSSPSSTITTVIIIIAAAVTASASIYLLLRSLSTCFRRSFSFSADDVVSLSSNHTPFHVAPSISQGILDSLPLFSFRSISRNFAGGSRDCAVCLSKFDPDDRLRLLPLCRHVFHAECIDSWITSNPTCPLCRSTVGLPPGNSDLYELDQILSTDCDNGSRGGSFRIEIGSISRRGGGGSIPAAAAEGAPRRRSYSLGTFEYIVDDDECEVPVDCTTHRKEVLDNGKFRILPDLSAEALAAEVAAGGRSWLREYVDKLSSRATSFRGSGRIFSSSRRCGDGVVVDVVAEDLEGNRAAAGEQFQ